MTPEGLWSDYQNLLSHAGVTFYYGGSAQLERVEETVRRCFAPLITARTVRTQCQVLAAPRGAVRTVTEDMDVTQGKLAMGFRTGGITEGSPDYPALLVLNALYGGSANSRLFLTVREKLSLCYYASSMLDKLKGLMVVSSGVEFQDFDRAQEAILAQLDELRVGRFTQEELNAAVRSVVSSLRGRRDSQSMLEDDCVTKLVCGLRPDGGGELIRAVERVTAEQAAEAAKKIQLDTIDRKSVV